MAKFYGKVGYVETVETRPGVFTQSVTERTYCGDLVRNSRRNKNLSEPGGEKTEQIKSQEENQNGEI